MPKEILYVVIIAIFVIAFTRGPKDKNIKYPIDKELSRQEIVSKIKLGMSESDVIKVIGQPENVTSTSEPNSTKVLTKYSISFYQINSITKVTCEFSFLNGKLFDYKIATSVPNGRDSKLEIVNYDSRN